MDDTSDMMDILDRLDEGVIGVDEALDQISHSDSAHTFDPYRPPLPKRRWIWWVLPLMAGMACVLAGIGLTTIGGWWWLLAAPLLIIGTVMTIYGFAAIDAPWIYLDIETGEADWPQRIRFAIPLPLSMIHWVLRISGSRLSSLKPDEIERLVKALSSDLTAANPIQIDVQDEDSEERIRIYIGY